MDAPELERYVRLAEADDAPPEEEPPVSDGRNLRTTEASLDDSNEAYWTVYGTAGDSVVVTLARALGAVSNVRPTELRPTLAEVIDVDALQRLAQREEVSVYAQFRYEGYDVVVDGGEIRLYESE
ncbi:HalOD1 output domain-containing protein [Haladaptatus salinisoli]|uniref:HalOD1 output domain-containing protein n=1 Tax=Haladaptatus salinisoli TaxID=2884876 RepID=UPI003F5FAF06